MMMSSGATSASGVAPVSGLTGIAGIVGQPAGERMLGAAALRMRSCERARRRDLHWIGPPGLAVGCGFAGDPDNAVAVIDGELLERPGGVVERQGVRAPPWSVGLDPSWVLAQRYREEGAALLDRVRGSFALAIWEPNERRLLLARDRYGGRPLYWRRWTHGLAFSSSIALLLAAEPSRPRPDLEAVDQALALGWVPAPRTGFEGVEKLPPGGVLEWIDGRLETGRHWWLGFEPPAATLEPRGALDSLEDALDASVRRHLGAARRPGLWLSGGLDSTHLAALASEVLGVRDRSRLVTLTARFPNTALDEGAAARETARRIGSEHHELVLGLEELAAGLDAAIAINEEPWSASPSAVIAGLAERSASAGCDVVLTGDGADELFSGGHQWSHVAALAALRAAVPREWALSRARQANDLTTRNRWLAIAAAEPQLAELESTRRLSRDERERIVRSAHRPPSAAGSAIAAARLPEEILRRCWSAVDRRTAIDLLGRMAECLLPESSKQLAHRGLRLATPFLDDRFVDVVRALPASARLRPGHPKWLLATLARRRLPRSSLAREKIGLRYPPPLIALLEKRLLTDCARLRPFGADRLRRWLAEDGPRRDPRALVTVYTVGRWWQIHFD